MGGGASRGLPLGGATEAALKYWGYSASESMDLRFLTGPYYPKVGVCRVNREGTGLYNFNPFGRPDPTFPKHTMQTPLNPPPTNVKMPVIVFGESGCAGIVTMFPNFLAEVAGHGYVFLANGAPGKVPETQFTGDTDLTNVINDFGGARIKPEQLT
jgi:hypothetical protein